MEGHWYQDRAAARDIQRQFSNGAPVPNNPVNLRSFQRQASPFPYDPIAKGQVTQVSPYGDGRTFLSHAQEPVAVQPTPVGALMAAPELTPGVEVQAFLQTQGYGEGSPLARIDAAQQVSAPQQAAPAAPQQLGMSTSPSLINPGTRRDVPMGA